MKKIKPGSLLWSDDSEVFVFVKCRINRSVLVIHYPDGVDDMCADDEVRMLGQKYESGTHFYELIQEPGD